MVGISYKHWGVHQWGWLHTDPFQAVLEPFSSQGPWIKGPIFWGHSFAQNYPLTSMSCPTLRLCWLSDRYKYHKPYSFILPDKYQLANSWGTTLVFCPVIYIYAYIPLLSIKATYNHPRMVGLWHWVYHITSWLLLGFVSPSSKPYCSDCFASNPISGPANSVTLFGLLILLRVPANFGVMGYDPYTICKGKWTLSLLAFNWRRVFSSCCSQSSMAEGIHQRQGHPSNPVAHLQVGAVKQPASLPLKTRENDWSKIFTTASENSAYCFMKIDHLQFQWKSPRPEHHLPPQFSSTSVSFTSSRASGPTSAGSLRPEARRMSSDDLPKFIVFFSMANSSIPRGYLQNHRKITRVSHMVSRH